MTLCRLGVLSRAVSRVGAAGLLASMLRNLHHPQRAADAAHSRSPMEGVGKGYVHTGTHIPTDAVTCMECSTGASRARVNGYAGR
jgi:hypothetical protein